MSLMTLQIITGGIKAIQEVVWAANSDSNTHSLKSHLDSSGTQYDSSAQTTTATGYLPYYYIQETDPNTSAAWTVAGVDQCQFGLNPSILTRSHMANLTVDSYQVESIGFQSSTTKIDAIYVEVLGKNPKLTVDAYFVGSIR